MFNSFIFSTLFLIIPYPYYKIKDLHFHPVAVSEYNSLSLSFIVAVKYI